MMKERIRHDFSSHIIVKYTKKLKKKLEVKAYSQVDVNRKFLSFKIVRRTIMI